MRKLTPYDDVMCFCKTPSKVTVLGTAGRSATAAQNCQCLALPAQYLPPGLRTVKQFEAWDKARGMKRTQFKVLSVSVGVPEVIVEPRP